MNRTVLLVDDEVNILNSFKRNLRNHIDIELASSGKEALQLISNKQYAVIVSDMKMPEMSGLELLMAVKETSPETVRLMFTGNSDQKTAADAVNHADVFKFINKPCSSEDLLIYINAGLRQYDLLIAERVLLNKTLKGVINVLSEVMSIAVPDITDNTHRVQFHMLNLAKAIKLKKHWSFEPIIKLSQLGYILFPETTLKNINNGKLVSEQDKQLFEQHPSLAYDLLKQIPRMDSIAKTLLYQQKCFNGEGIPNDDVKGKDIPLGARMLKIVCDFCSLEKSGFTNSEALLALDEQADFYDPELLKAFKTSLVETNKLMSVDVRSLNPSMVIEQEITTERGQLVAKKGQRVTHTLMKIIHHCIENKAISGEVRVAMLETEKIEKTQNTNRI
ncbi:HD domain-containing phosphohydrolase [Vibrio sp.]|uniref:HD domain-containing phosphohydrolase n=1 Tax=Vibrio sp. TaxID=678 RepID=UPI0031203929